MSTLTPRIVHSSKLFSVTDKKLVAEASTLGHGRFEFTCRVYDDSCDEGFGILSDATGKIVSFAVDRYEQDSEGEIQAWHLIPLPEEVRKNRGLAGWTATVFND